MILMRGKHLLPLLLSMFFLSACCHTDNFPAGNNEFLRPAEEAPEPAPAEPLGGGNAAPFVDVVPRSLERIPIGTVIGRDAPKDWTNLILFATPTLTEEDLRDAPKMATHYAKMFKFTLLANVAGFKGGGKATYQLQKVARGFAIDINGKETVIEGRNTLGADLGIFGKSILAENEKILDKDVYQVARTATMLVFDAQSNMLFGKEHVKRIMRHAVLTDPDTGRVRTLVWLLAKGPSGYVPAEKAIQLLPPNMQEARLLHVLKDKFTLGIPSPDAFALVRIPQGQPIAYTPELQQTATVAAFNRDQVFALELALRRATQMYKQ
jgi:hypothetical protein